MIKNRKIRVYGQDNHNTTRNYLKQHHANYYYDSKIKNIIIRMLMRELGIKRQPLILVVNKNDQITNYWSGFQPSKLREYVG